MGSAFGRRPRRWLPDRQLILCEAEGARTIRVSFRAQLLVLCGGAIAALSTMATTGTYLAQYLPARSGPVRPLLEAAADAPLILPDDVPAESAPSAAPAAPAPGEQAAPPVAAVSPDRVANLERALREAQRQLGEAEAAQHAALRERDSLALRLADTERRMRLAAAQHEAALSRLTQETRRSIDEVERIIAAAGLSPTRLRSEGAGEGRGGPFVPWRKHAAAETPARGDEAVGSGIARLDELVPLLRAMPLSAPLPDFAITSPFGPRIDPFNGLRAMHEGLDMQASLHTPVAATATGRVVFAGRRRDYGLMIEIDHGLGIHTRYAHLDRILVTRGQAIAAHQKIGLLGSTGRASGPHLHYEVLVDGEPRDPVNFLEAMSHVRKRS
ncbi:MAG TPA: M23 family metallopeptidase [Stellaceae bacterium]|nr:M23 family metallopeptidase [Stellaceae bacterium]